MGQQVRFYLTLKDLHAIEKCIHKCGEYLVLHSRSPNKKPRIVPSLNFEEYGERWLSFRLVRPDDLAFIRMRHVSEQNYWAIDRLRSPVVEFSSGFFDGVKMRHGRLYFQTRYFGKNDELLIKPDPFVKWARCVLAAVKKALHRHPTRHAYVGPDTMIWVEQKGGILLP